MKKRLVHFLALLILGILVPMPTFSYSDEHTGTEIDGIYYDLDDSTATVIQPYIYDKTIEDYTFTAPYKGFVDIPSSVEYKGHVYSVVEIRGAFYDCKELTSVTIPNSVKTISSSSVSIIS